MAPRYGDLLDKIYEDNKKFGCRFFINFDPANFKLTAEKYLLSGQYQYKYVPNPEEGGEHGMLYYPDLKDPFTGEEGPVAIFSHHSVTMGTVQVVDTAPGSRMVQATYDVAKDFGDGSGHQSGFGPFPKGVTGRDPGTPRSLTMPEIKALLQDALGTGDAELRKSVQDVVARMRSDA